MTVPEGPSVGNPGVGAACGLAVDGKTSITVEDDNQDGVGFSWVAFDANDEVCDDGTSTEDSATITPAEGCTTIDIFPGLGATTGTITVSDVQAL